MRLFPSRRDTLPVVAPLLLSAVVPGRGFGQCHRPAALHYLVRDEKGALLEPAKLDSISARKGEETKPGKTFVKERGERIRTVKRLWSRIDLGGKPVRLGELSLKYRGQTMRLIFNVSVVQEGRVIDSPSFRDGTFKLEKGK
jgi:hypothetical protein